MFKIKDEPPGRVAETQKSGGGQTQSRPLRNQLWKYVVEACIIVAMGVLLFWGASTQFSNPYNDATRYQCYAITFWQGKASLQTLGLYAGPKSQCAFLDASSTSTFIQKMQERHFPAPLIKLAASQPASEPFHALPPEYPILSLVPFSLPLLAPTQWYQVTFAMLMAIVAGIIYLVLVRYRSRSAAIAFAIYLVLGSWATAAGRFDLIPAGLTLGAVILAGRARWKWAFALLALATLLKIYPAVLIPPFLIAQQLQSKDRWLARSRWSAAGVFIGICVLGYAVSLTFNVADTVEPFNYLLNRPIQVESLPGTLLWFGNFLGYPTQYIFTYQSLNYLSALSNRVSLLMDLLLAVGLLFTFWLQWRGKLDFYVACLLTMLIVISSGKVFSPQYLIWVAPLIAYVGKSNWKWLVSWGCVAVLTTVIFPFMYADDARITKGYEVILARDWIIVVIVCVLLLNAVRTSRKAALATTQNPERQPI